ncbi:hypothetical protein KC957_01335 [Candidatus Saccharibacteria bacterium]|nr:hypothetical protein [Candidatus Saccharibacteria bacterium]
MENSSGSQHDRSTKLLGFHAQMQQWLIEKLFHANPRLERERQCNAYYGRSTAYLRIHHVTSELGDNHTLDSLDLTLSTILSRESRELQKQMQDGIYPSKATRERVAVYQGLRELVKSVAHLFRTQEYIHRRQIAGNPYLPHLLHCVPALAAYILDKPETSSSIGDWEGKTTLSPAQKALLRDLQGLLMDGTDQEIYHQWQTNAGWLAQHMGPSQRERVTLAEQRLQLAAEFHAAFVANDARQVFTLHQEMLAMGMTADADLDRINQLREAGRLICLIEAALNANEQEKITDLYYRTRHGDEAALIPLSLQNRLTARWSQLV